MQPPSLWKRDGTDSQNQPEVHLILQALRTCLAVAAPGVLFKAEAIVAPQQLTQYLGAHDRFRPECDLAYHNQLMVMLWSTLATRDVTLARQSLTSLRPAPPSTAWVTYLRGHATSAGRCPTRTPVPSASTRRRTGASSATSTPGRTPAPSHVALPSWGHVWVTDV